MLENFLILSYFCLIITFQSIIGVGVLVLGTPFLLILEYEIVDILFILLPISIVTSLLNLIIINFSNKTVNRSTYKEFKKFFIICIPSIFVGLFLLKIFNNYLNFKLLVSLIIFFSISLIIIKDKINFRINFFRISILSIVGIVHGLTNSGGTLMSLALSTNNNKNYARLNTSLFYLILASFQYLLTLIIFFDNFSYLNNHNLIFVLIIGVTIGNLINHFLKSEIYRMMVNILAVLSAMVLLIS